MSHARTLATQEMSAATARGIHIQHFGPDWCNRRPPAIKSRDRPALLKDFHRPQRLRVSSGPPSAMTSSCAWAAEIGRVGLRRAPRFVGPTDRRPRAGEPIALWTNPDNGFWRAKRGTVGDNFVPQLFPTDSPFLERRLIDCTGERRGTNYSATRTAILPKRDCLYETDRQAKRVQQTSRNCHNCHIAAHRPLNFLGEQWASSIGMTLETRISGSRKGTRVPFPHLSGTRNIEPSAECWLFAGV